jgi:hypothetical protein
VGRERTKAKKAGGGGGTGAGPPATNQHQLPAHQHRTEHRARPEHRPAHTATTRATTSHQPPAASHQQPATSSGGPGARGRWPVFPLSRPGGHVTGPFLILPFAYYYLLLRSCHLCLGAARRALHCSSRSPTRAGASARRGVAAPSAHAWECQPHARVEKSVAKGRSHKGVCLICGKRIQMPSGTKTKKCAEATLN